MAQSCTSSNVWLKPAYAMLLRFKRSHINGEAILYIRTGQSVIGLVDLLDWDDFYVGSDVVFAAKVEHLLRFSNTPDERAREAATLEQKAKGRDGIRLVRCADEGYVAVGAEQLYVCVNVVLGRDRVEDEVEAA